MYLATDALFYKNCIKINRPSFYLVCYRIEFSFLYLRSVSCCVAKTTQASMCESTALIGIFYCQHSHIAYAWCSSTALFVLQILIPVLVCCSVQLIWLHGIGCTDMCIDMYTDTRYDCVGSGRYIADIQHIALRVSKTVQLLFQNNISLFVFRV